MPRYAQLDASNILVSYVDVSDQRDLALNTPPGGSTVLSNTNFTPGTMQYNRATGTFVAMAQATLSAAQTLQNMFDVIDDERTMLMRPLLTTGQEIKYEYANKAREVRDYRSMSATLVASILSSLTSTETRQRFAWALAEVDDTGDTLPTVITRYEDAMKRTALTQKIAARAQKLKRQMRAATTPAAQKAIFDARTWPTS